MLILNDFDNLNLNDKVNKTVEDDIVDFVKSIIIKQYESKELIEIHKEYGIKRNESIIKIYR